MSGKREKPHWEGKHYSFFQNTECEYFPCHRIADPTRFNCLFCYCPLYMLGPGCGGNFRYTEKGIKDCTGCVIPHLPENYGRIIGKYGEITSMMQKDAVVSDEKEAVENPQPADLAAKVLQPADLAVENPQSTDLSADSLQSADFFMEKSQPVERKSKGSAQSPKKDSAENVHQGQASFLNHSMGLEAETVSANCGRKREARLHPSFGRIVMMACTERGFVTMRRAAAALADLLPEAEILQTGRCAHVPGFEDGPRLSDLTAKWFHEADALFFFAATGIAVRCIAPFARDKFRDPAVLVADENGRFVISLMSGHAGGANRLSLAIADALGAQPVITTATDGRGLFAVDVFAVEKGLRISDRTIAKQISARILSGETLKVFYSCRDDGSEPAIISCEPMNVPDENAEGKYAENNSVIPGAELAGAGKKPAGKKQLSENGAELPGAGRKPAVTNPVGDIEQYGEGICRTENRNEADIIISCRRKAEDRENALYLIPSTVTLGIGCRRGIGEEAIRKTVRQALQTTGIFRQAIVGIASIDLKKEEQGLLAFAEDWGLPIIFYTAEELNEVPGEFTASDFVRNVTGVDCVCERSAVRLARERAAVRGSGDDKDLLLQKKSIEGAADLLLKKKSIEGAADLLLKKKSIEGVTVAMAAMSGE